MRAAFSDAMVQLARADSNVVLLTGDHGYALFDAFRRECPDQYINAGIAEQNMVGMAAGLARTGFRPIVYGLSAFIPVRVIEQIKLDVAHDRLPVIFIGDGAGFVYSHLGTSHQSTEDIACTRAIPNLAVYSPADRYEVSACMQSVYQANGSAYLRMGKSDRGDVHAGPVELSGGELGQIGQLLPVLRGVNGHHCVSFIATGSMVRTAMDIAREEYADAPVWSVPVIKPIDADQVASICRKSDVVVTLEEHSVQGGLGSLVAEIASERAPVRILRIGVSDRFSVHCGSYDYLLREHGLERSMVAEQLRRYLAATTK